MSVIVRAVQPHPTRPMIGEDVHPTGTTFGTAEGVLSVGNRNGNVALYSAGNWVAAWIEQSEANEVEKS